MFGLLQADPITKLGYEDISIPGFTVGGFLGSGSFSNVFEATPTSDSDIETQQLPQVVLPAMYEEHSVEGDGNCFFHAIAHQLKVAGERVNDEDYNHELLRALALSCVNDDARFRLMMSDAEYLDLSQLTGYVDHAAIAALASALGVNIIIYGACSGDGEPLHINSVGEVGPEISQASTIRILYNGFNHYSSVVPCAKESLTAPTNSKSKRKRPLSSSSYFTILHG